MSEEWRDIPGYEGRYQVSNLGQVRSLDRPVRCRGGAFRTAKGKVLRPAPHKSGHLMVMLGRRNNADVHVLVLRAFVGPPPPKHEALHEDHNPAHNALSNPRWGTRSENVKMDYAVGVRKTPTWLVGARWR